MAIDVFSPRYLTEVVRNIRTDVSSFRGAELLTGGSRLKTETGLTIEYDVVYDATGMTPPTGLNDESPIYTQPVIDHLSFQNQEWREKVIIDREKIATLRKPGTSWEQQWAEDYMTERMMELDQRLETRFEWLRWKALSGKITIPKTANKPARTIDYKVPARQFPTAATLWSNTANADPQADIDAWKLLFRGTGAQAKTIIVSQKVDTLLKQNQKIRDLIKTTLGKDLVTSDTLAQTLKQALNGLEYVVYDGGYLDEDTGEFFPFVPDNVCIIIGKGTTGTMMDLVTSPNNYTDIFRGRPGKFGEMKHIQGDPDQWIAVNGATVLPKMKYVTWHVYATVA